jgi:hypothetical protein
MALVPKQIEELRARRAQAKQEKQERLANESLDTEVIENSVAEDQKPKFNIASIILKQGQKLAKLFIPLALNLVKQYGVDKLKEEIDKQDISPEELKEQFCSIDFDTLIQKRNDAVGYLNQTGAKLDSLTFTVEFGAGFGNLLQGLITRIKQGQTIANTAMSFIPFALPGAVPAAINTAGTIADNLTFNADGTPKLPPITITASQVSPAVASTQSVILKCVALLEQLDLIILFCNPNATLDPISDSINQVVETEKLAEESDNQTTYKGFVLEIEEKPFSNSVTQRRAVGKNKSEIVLIATEWSFASNPNVLINELKFIIDRDDLKAY